MSVDARNCNDKHPVSWDVLTRRYIALQDEAFLLQAIETAKETTEKEIVQILEYRLNKKYGQFEAAVGEVFPDLITQGRLDEGLTLDLLELAIRSLLLNEFDGLSPDEISERIMIGFDACQEGILDAQSLPDRACEAFFKGIIGNGLYEIGNFEKAEELYAEALKIWREPAEELPGIYLPGLARMHNNLAALYEGNMRSAEAKENYAAALKIWRTLAKNDSQKYLPDLALLLNNFGNYEALNTEYSTAQNLLTESLEIYQSLATDDRETYLPLVALTFNSLGVLQQELYEVEKAEEFFNEALKIRRHLAQVDPKTYSTDLAHSLNSFGNFYRSINEFAKAEKFLNEALKIRRKLGKNGSPHNLSRLAETLNNLAILQSGIDKLAKAEKFYKEALKIWRKLEIKSRKYLPDLAEALNSLAVLQNKLNKFEESEASLEEALKIRRQLAEDNRQRYSSDVADTLNNLGNFNISKNEFALSEKAYSEALRIYRKLAKKDPKIYLHNIAQTLDNLATLQNKINKFTKAEDFYSEALKIRRKLVKISSRKYLPDLARTLNNLAVLQQELYEFEKAEKLYAEAFKIYQSLVKVDPAAYLPNVATILNNRALLKKRTNKFAAEKFFIEALDLLNKLTESGLKIYQPDKARLLSNLSAMKYKANKFKEAIDYGTQAEAIYRELAKDNPSSYLPDLAKILNNLAASQNNSKELVAAEKLCCEALEIIRDLAKKKKRVYLPDLVATLNNLGHLQYQSDQYTAARKTYSEALRKGEKLAAESFNYLPEVAHIHSNFGYLLIAEKNYETALKHFTKAMEIAQQLRENSLGITSRRQIFQKYNSIYLGLLICHIMHGSFEKAIEIAEQGKSRSLNDHLNLQVLFPKIPSNISAGRSEKLTSDFKKLIQTIRDAEVTESIISESFQKSLELISDGTIKNPDQEDKENKIKRAEKKLFKLWDERNVLLNKIRKIDPHYPPQIKDLNFEQIADVSQQSKHAIVMFRVFEIASFIFIVFPDRSYKVIAVKEFTSKNLNKLSFAQIKNNRFKTGIREKNIKRDSSIGVKKNNFDLMLNLLKEVNEKLIKPVKSKLRIKKVKDVVFVPNGMLTVLPLHACFDEVEEQYLLEEFNIKFTTSVSVFKRNLELKQQRQIINKLMFVANPRCDLENAEAEVKAICYIYGLNYEDYEHNLIREKATYQAVQDKLFGEFDIFHFACHGDYEWEEPFSSSLKLADGESIILKEIMQTNLSLARLVVLSACKSGLVDYRDISDEHYGFPFGFTLAGAPSVWATLWSVDDKATSFLLTKAYQNLKNQTESFEEHPSQDEIDPSEALRQAQIDVLKNSSYKSPYYWAGFQHFGI